ncbi:putative ankyrin repeat domain protein [Fusarium austroafricanum]|uniref:Putative ankyrin repeat domain protein n=1 Tax=Fusarium austroafricanum TaxID=2364996 RepID=A0A8H4NQ30_9HYPO|nr:putative ankyrin repeat domain protein [Fusarium austroafricanum]
MSSIQTETALTPETLSRSCSDELSAISDLAETLYSEGFARTSSDHISKGAALRWAVQNSHVQLVRQLIDQGADFAQQDVDGWDSLYFAAAWSTPQEVLEILINAGANVDARCSGEFGFTALHRAVCSSNSVAVQTLVSRGAVVDSRATDNRVPLHLAAGNGCVEAIQILLDAGADIESRGDSGWTALVYASGEGHLEASRLLIKRGAIIWARTLDGDTAFLQAAYNGRSDVVRELINLGANIRDTDNNERTALHLAAMNNSSIATAQLLLDYGFDIEARDESGRTPLATAVRQNAMEMAKFLLENGANMETKTDAGETPLHEAVWFNFRQMVQLLLENGANTESRDMNGRTALLDAARSGKFELVRSLVDYGADVKATTEGATGIHEATHAHSKVLIRFFIENGVPVDARMQSEGHTALMNAATDGNAEIVSLLIRQGADTNAVDSDGFRPLHFAARWGHKQIVEILLENAANPIAETVGGLSAQEISETHGYDDITKLLEESVPVSIAASRSIAALLLAAELGHLDRILQILDKGVDINSLDIDGRSVLSLAAEHGHADVVVALTQRGADLDIKDANGGSPLWWASRYGYENIVEHLASQGAHINTQDADGQSPMSVASQYGHLATIKVLLDHGGDSNTCTAYGKTALLFAVGFGRADVVELLLESGASVHYKSPQGDTALSLAKNAHPELVDVIRAALTRDSTNGSGVETRDSEDQSCSTIHRKHYAMLLEASRGGHVAMINRLIESGLNPNSYSEEKLPLLEAAEHGQLEAVEALMAHGADLYLFDKDGNRRIDQALRIAAVQGHTKLVIFFHTHGADLEVKDKEGRSPLLEAARAGQSATVLYLLEKGTNTESRDAQGGTPLWYAASNGHETTVHHLHEHGANIESADASGCTPLMMSVKKRDRKLTSFFLKAGAQMRPESGQNYSPLCSAADSGDEAMVDLLLDHGASLDYYSDNKRTALHIAALRGNTMVVRMLIEAGAKVDLKDADGRTALSLAKERSYDSTIRILRQALGLREKSQRASRKAQEQGLGHKALYQYQPLTKESSIRVLELYPGKPGEILSFDLNEVQLNLNVSFEALSYEWKEKSGSVPVQCGDEKILITPNCKAAMERLRLESRSRYLWIDAICINQEDHQERTQQVAMMAGIFGAAEKVLMWHGEETESTRAAFEVIPTMARARRMMLQADGELPLDEPPIEKDNDPLRLIEGVLQDKMVLEGFKDLSNREYYNRAWIFQEIVLGGSRGVAICGSQSCPSQVMLFAMVFDEWLSKHGTVPLGEVAAFLKQLDATDPRDKIFACLGLASTETKLVERPVADYTMTVEQVYVHAARYIIDTDDSPHLVWTLGVRHSTKKFPGLPSWVPDYREREGELEQTPFRDHGLNFELNTTETPVTTESSLRISGCIVDKIAFKLTIKKDLCLSKIILSAVQAIEKQGRSIYDIYPIGGEPDSDRNDTPRIEGDEHLIPNNTNAMVMFTTMMDFKDKPAAENDTTTPETLHRLSIGYLTWLLSKAEETSNQEAPNQDPGYAQQARKIWSSMSSDKADFTDFLFTKLQSMEGMLRYGKDLVYTEKGYFGLTNSGEAEEGMSVAMISRDNEFRLLRKRETFYEFVDTVFFNFLDKEFSEPEDIYKGLELERLELR